MLQALLIFSLIEMMLKNTHETESNGSMTCGYEDTKLSKVETNVIEYKTTKMIYLNIPYGVIFVFLILGISRS